MKSRMKFSILVFLALIVISGCSSTSNETASSTLVESVIANNWNITSFTDDTGRLREIPEDAQWGIRFFLNESESQFVLGSNTDMQTGMAVGFGPCAIFYLAYLLSDETLTTFGNIISPVETCTAIAPIQLPEAERSVVSMFTNSQTFSVTLDPANVLVISSGLNEVLTLTASD